MRGPLVGRTFRAKLKGKYPEGSWYAFVAKFYDGGSKLVPNPNPKGRSKEVRFDTAYKNEKFRKKVEQDYEKYLKSLDKKPNKPADKELSDDLGNVPRKTLENALERLEREEARSSKVFREKRRSQRPLGDLPKDLRNDLSALDPAKRKRVLERALEDATSKTARRSNIARLLREARHHTRRTAGWEGFIGAYRNEPSLDVTTDGNAVRIYIESPPEVLMAATPSQAIKWLTALSGRAQRSIRKLQRLR